MLLQGNPSNLRLFLIDFGLSSFEASAEDKGVDLYVLERAFLSSHPNSQELFNTILNSYQAATKNVKSCKEIIAKLEEVRMRGILTPTIFMVNFQDNSIYMEEIQDAITAKQYITDMSAQGDSSSLLRLAEVIGQTLSKMHASK
uniref:non-specific serine/threonine protein kinase n=1 Tax=Biomphalaria glabrata TaxID=6526 RepID=A0A2C9M5G3_BIOGL